MRVRYKALGTAFAAIGVTAWLSGCSDFGPVPAAKPTTGRLPTVAEVPEANETVRGENDPPVVTLELGPRLQERRLLTTEDLPGSIIVPTTNLTAVPVTAALQAVLAGTDVSLSWDTAAYENRLVSVSNLSGSLPTVVTKICASAKVFCSYRHGLLELKDKETFIISLPAMPSKTTAGSGNTAAAASNTMADAISELAGDKVKIDQQGGNLIYTTDVEGQDRVREYLRELRNGRPLIVMQLYIWEVTLNKDNGAGINWTSFKFPRIGGAFQDFVLGNAAGVATGFTSLTSPGVSLGATMSGAVDADTVMQFLSTQGRVQTISNPQMTFISGSNAEFRVGGKQRYISQVGQLTSSNVSGTSTSSSSVGTNTISTDSIDTGLSLNIGGNYEGGVISAVLEMAMEDVVSLNPTTTSGVTIDLPETTERKVTTTLRVRPGDNLVLAGLVTSRDTNDREGIPTPFGGGVPTYAKDELENNEMVILVKPSIVFFADGDSEGKSGVTTGKGKNKAKRAENAKPALDAIVIDKDGAKTLKLPDPTATPTAMTTSAAGVAASTSVPTQTAVTPELMVPAADSTPIGDVPIAPSQDGAPVDKRLLQRGFSHAYDELLEPVSIEKTKTVDKAAATTSTSAGSP